MTRSYSSGGLRDLLKVSEEVRDAVATNKPVVALDVEMIPAEYMAMLPQPAKEAFQAPKFEWGKIPDWVPPRELR